MTGPGGASPLSPRNHRIASLRRLSRRRSARSEAGEFVVEGPKLVLEALAAGLEVRELYVQAGTTAADAVRTAATASGAACFEVVPEVLAGALDVVTPHAVAAVVRMPSRPVDDVAALVRRGPVLALDAVGDPGNVGTVLRAAEGAGMAGVVLGGGSVDVWSPKVVRAAAGSLFRLPVIPTDDLVTALAVARAAGARCFGAAADGVPYDEADLDGPLVVVVGSEAHGLSPAVRAAVDGVIGIPLAGEVESLNVAVATGVLAFELARRRGDSRR